MGVLHFDCTDLAANNEWLHAVLTNGVKNLSVKHLSKCGSQSCIQPKKRRQK